MYRMCPPVKQSRAFLAYLRKRPCVHCDVNIPMRSVTLHCQAAQMLVRIALLYCKNSLTLCEFSDGLASLYFCDVFCEISMRR